jgi:hypothetical protein
MVKVQETREELVTQPSPAAHPEAQQALDQPDQRMDDEILAAWRECVQERIFHRLQPLQQGEPLEPVFRDDLSDFMQDE